MVIVLFTQKLLPLISFYIYAAQGLISSFLGSNLNLTKNLIFLASISDICPVSKKSIEDSKVAEP